MILCRDFLPNPVIARGFLVNTSKTRYKLHNLILFSWTGKLVCGQKEVSMGPNVQSKDDF